MISKKVLTKLFTEFLLENNLGHLKAEDAINILNWFYDIYETDMKKEVSRREDALLMCHRIRFDNEEKLLGLLKKERDKKLEFIRGLMKTIERPYVFNSDYIKTLNDVLLIYRDHHPEIKQSDIEQYKPVVETGKTFADQADLTIVVNRHYCENQEDEKMMPCADQCSTCKENNNKHE